ncbi:DNA-directed RNA polymerase III subunit [Martiniozyma asiatica (nom. inval.)]|nr:DNA-directed RNA polymerase III subunit [Martiniozyma asiatica]
MFQLTTISDLISVPPHLFNLPRNVAIEQQLNVKYANKVIQNIGLVISIFDLLEYDTGMFKPGDGDMFVNIKCRLVIFKPFVGEVLTGYIEECKEDGIKVNMGFFDDIFIPKSLLFENSNFSEPENAWIWQMGADDEEEEPTTLYLDVNEKINFRVEELIFTDVKTKSLNVNPNPEEDKNKAPPFALIASAQNDGMGCCSWWE